MALFTRQLTRRLRSRRLPSSKMPPSIPSAAIAARAVATPISLSPQLLPLTTSRNAHATVPHPQSRHLMHVATDSSTGSVGSGSSANSLLTMPNTAHPPAAAPVGPPQHRLRANVLARHPHLQHHHLPWMQREDMRRQRERQRPLSPSMQGNLSMASTRGADKDMVRSEGVVGSGIGRGGNGIKQHQTTSSVSETRLASSAVPVSLSSAASNSTDYHRQRVSLHTLRRPVAQGTTDEEASSARVALVFAGLVSRSRRLLCWLGRSSVGVREVRSARGRASGWRFVRVKGRP